jgi:hypothetical protein
MFPVRHFICATICLAGLLAGGAAALDLPPTMQLSDDATQLEQGKQASTGLYDESVLRTIHLEFEQEDWWDQLTANYVTEEDIPATLTMDGIDYRGVGVRFKGMTSYTRTGDTQKKPFNISLHYTNPDQRLMGYRTLNLNNANTDPAFVREVLYFNALRRYTPGPRACFVKLVINGESWGVYVHAQQNNADLIEEWFLDSDGSRWKADGAAGGTGGIDGRVDAGGIAPPPPDSTAVPGNLPPPPGGGQPPTGGVRPPTDGRQPPAGGIQPPPDGQAPGGIQITLEQWLASPDAADLNDDGTTDQADFDLFLAQRQQPGDAGGGGFVSGDKALMWLGSDPALYEAQYELKSTGPDDPWAALVTTCDVLNNTTQEELPDTIETVLAVDRWLWFLAAENVFTDDDSYLTKGADYQLYYDVVTGQIHPLEHDGNESFNVRSVQQDPLESEDNANRPVISRLLSVPEYRQRYLAHTRAILEDSFDWTVLEPSVQRYRMLIEDEVKADTKKLYTNEEFDSAILQLEDLVTSRRQFLLSHTEIARQAPEILSVDREAASGGEPQANQPVQITAEVGSAVSVGDVILYYADGAMGKFDRVPMYDDGDHGDNEAGDGMYGAQIPPHPTGSLVRYYVEARAGDDVGTAAFAPAGAEHDVYAYQIDIPRAASSPVVINELMAANDAAVQDPQGDYDDWIELLNVSDQDVDLSGMYLTDTDTDLRRWAFPEGTTLSSGGRLIVWADGDDGDAPGLHAGFKLSASGESVLLVDSDEAGNLLLDSVTFGPQWDDASFGRYPDGSGDFSVLAPATPESANAGVRQAGDCNGDGTVDFADFVGLAQHYGTHQGDPDFDSRYDLNGNGEVDFPDFLSFAQEMGNGLAGQSGKLTKPTGSLVGENDAADLSLAGQTANDRLMVTVGIRNAVEVGAYGLRVDFDPSALTFVAAETLIPSALSVANSSESSPIARLTDSGTLYLLEALSPDAPVTGDQNLARLEFSRSVGQPVGNVLVSEAVIADASGRISRLLNGTPERLFDAPAQFALHQNRPNPFNPQTQIAYELPVTSNVRLIVYNMLGQEVRTLVNGRRESGYHQALWDGRDVAGRSTASGVYFVHIQAGDFQAVQRMLLLR